MLVAGVKSQALNSEGVDWWVSLFWALSGSSNWLQLVNAIVEIPLELRFTRAARRGTKRDKDSGMMIADWGSTFDGTPFCQGSIAMGLQVPHTPVLQVQVVDARHGCNMFCFVRCQGYDTIQHQMYQCQHFMQAKVEVGGWKWPLGRAEGRTLQLLDFVDWLD